MKRSRSKRAKAGRGRQGNLAKDLQTEGVTFRRKEAVAVFASLLNRFHAADLPEPNKLREKDRLVIDLVADLDKKIVQQFQVGHITIFEAGFLQLIAKILMAIENVLWELKGNGPDVPLPEPRPIPPAPKPDSGPWG